MNEMLLGISPEYIYKYRKPPMNVSDTHRPYFLAFYNENNKIQSKRNDLIKQWKNNPEHSTLSKIVEIGEIETYKSFWDFNKTREIFKVFTEKSYLVPEVSSYLFFSHDLYTAEHDIPYHQRVLVDIAASNQGWLFDTHGKKENLKVLVYDIETTEFEAGLLNIPIDIIGYSDFNISFESHKNLANEEFSFDIIDCPSHNDDIDIEQLISRNLDEEIKNLLDFSKIALDHDIISGHNIMGFDNLCIYNRVNTILKNHSDKLSNSERKFFNDFINKYCRIDKSYYFGVGSEVALIYPCSFDTYTATRKFYPYLDSFSLKSVAPFIGVGIKDRIILSPSEIKIDEKTLKYNKQDVIEQIGVTLHLIQLALPLSFTTCMTFDNLLSSGAVNMWDHMSLIRGAALKKIMPPTCRALGIAQILCKDFTNCKNRIEIVRESKREKEHLSKEFIRVIKYGSEMPEWMLYPSVIYNDKATSPEERLNYHMPGGMTIKPDKEAKSHFIPWWYVIVADVGAMYPTILKAMNIGADTVRLSSNASKDDEWIWLKKLPKSFLIREEIKWSEISEEDTFADEGYKLGISIDKTPGVVNLAMTGIMSMIAKIKNELKDVEKQGNSEELKRLKMMYQSVKGARNAGTHGILAAPTVSGRQFNLWGAAAITTKGQIILDDTLKSLEEQGIRVVYGDTDGIYLGCSRSIGNIPNFSKVLNLTTNINDKNWLTTPKKAISAIKESNKKWQENLNYTDFELEAEMHDAMIFVKHKNYLIFDEHNGEIEFKTKGNNFKGADKANIARKVLKSIMIDVLKENHSWEEEDDVRSSVKNTIKIKTQEILKDLDLSKVDLDDLTLIQSVQPASKYKKNQDDSLSTFAKRVKALEKVLGYKIKSRVKLKFVVTKKPLPDIKKPSKSGVKPIDYMYPIDLLKNTDEIDLEWYKSMIENYIKGAFGLSDFEKTEQTGLDAWM